MKIARTLVAASAGVALLPTAAFSQVPDTLTAFDPGGRPMGMGGAGYLTGSDTFSSFFNPAGLGYVTRTMFGIAFRNLPSSTSAVTGDFDDPNLDTDASTGNLGITHLGFALPLRRGGAVGLAFTLGGYMDESRSGTGLPQGTLTINNYQESIKARTDFITLSYGQTSADQSFNWGLGVVCALQGIQNRQTGDIFDGNTQVGVLDVDNDETGRGFGFIGGIQMVPRGQPNTSYALSYRSEINLDENANTGQLYDKVPARLGLGFATRRDGFRGDRDYIVLGVEAQHFFGDNQSPLMDREAQTAVSAGIEYNYVAGFGRVPIRFGFHAVPAGGQGFSSRNAITAGVGYRPAGSDLVLDLNIAVPEKGGNDLSFTLSFKFK